jgi:hypothetical protein
MKKTVDNTFVSENIHLTQLLLHHMDEHKFNKSIGANMMNIQKIHSYLINLIHQINDNGTLDEEYLEKICKFLNIKEIDNVDDLISYLDRRRVQSYGLTPLTLYELRDYIQCIKFMALDSCVNLTRILCISDLTNTVRQMS